VIGNEAEQQVGCIILLATMDVNPGLLVLDARGRWMDRAITPRLCPTSFDTTPLTGTITGHDGRRPEPAFGRLVRSFLGTGEISLIPMRCCLTPPDLPTLFTRIER
jgi:hypothetical protein